VVKSKTTAGFIPNWSTGGLKSQDRTEPPVGAKVLLELYQKYKDRWLVEAVFDDLMDWNNWFMENRLLAPFDVIALGSFYNNSHDDTAMPPPHSNTMWAARMESGLDNSPMYDDDIFDVHTHTMNMSDVGMSSLVCQEAYSLATLADAIGREPSVGQKLRERGDSLLRSILAHFWDHDRQIFANRYHLKTNHTSVWHISPTSFYPFLFINTTVWKEYIHRPSTEVIETVIRSWLFNASRFCINPSGSFEENNNNIECYGGLPSISADDPTYMSGNWNYWRGLIWGPMSQIVFWSLQIGAGNAVVDHARKSLCRQMERLMMRQWLNNGHICENYR
jgi:putative isomerase